MSTGIQSKRARSALGLNAMPTPARPREAESGLPDTRSVNRVGSLFWHVDREERALGNDPEKELREKEAFQTYERAEEPPLRGSRCSLNDDSAEIGSDGDGELDDYNLDPGKFNEEGSFIGEYATERHKSPSNRLPTLDRNYNPTV
ncbi:unnamed protein product [Schistosoma mattheei]|uniref:Neurofascin/L1/NrCAM C-terminal domain-containing protein n=1 Tax=Schistosoma mattheei TaxID=31246 RepID=A0A3P8KK45_9TREM|nr:unnamed protein product [Schistosoma mattheei]